MKKKIVYSVDPVVKASAQLQKKIDEELEDKRKEKSIGALLNVIINSALASTVLFFLLGLISMKASENRAAKHNRVLNSRSRNARLV